MKIGGKLGILIITLSYNEKKTRHVPFKIDAQIFIVEKCKSRHLKVQSELFYGSGIKVCLIYSIGNNKSLKK